MDKKFLIKVLIVTAAVLVVYYIISPFQNCKRALSGGNLTDKYIAIHCSQQESW